MDEIDGTGWGRLTEEWLANHEKWEDTMSASGENMFGLLEEHLNIFHWNDEANLHQVDLLVPIKKKQGV
jgi:hypothetical protein